jgi:drug/metabolite transporter (DMT)-like permease
MIAAYAVGDACFLTSTRSLGVPGALAIASSYPLWTALMGGDALTPMRILGLVMTVAGIGTVILFAPGKSESRVGNKWVGVGLALATSLFWALNGYAVSRGTVGVLSPVGNCVRMVWALLLTYGISRFLAPRGERILIRPRELGRDLWVFMAEAFAGSYFFVYGLAHSPLVVAATLSSLAPVLAVPVAWFLRLERISPFRTLGVILVVVGLTLLV